jgi:hypothetical protein
LLGTTPLKRTIPQQEQVNTFRFIPPAQAQVNLTLERKAAPFAGKIPFKRSNKLPYPRGSGQVLSSGIGRLKPPINRS